MKNELPESGFVRLRQIIGRPATAHSPGITPLIPVSRSTWYAGVAIGKYPAPIRHGERCSLYRVEDIRALIARMGAKAVA